MERQEEPPRGLPAAGVGTRTCEHPYVAACSWQTRSEGWRCRGRCKSEERHSEGLAGREERGLKSQTCYTRSGSIPMLNAAPTEARSSGQMRTQNCQCQQRPGTLGTRVTPPTKDIRSNCMNEPVCHNQQPRATRNLQTQKGSKLPPRKAPRSQLLPRALPFAVSHTASPEILPGPAQASSPVGHEQSLGRLTSSLHPHIHTAPTAPASRARGLGWGVPARAFLRSPVDPFQRGPAAGGMCSYL